MVSTPPCLGARRLLVTGSTFHLARFIAPEYRVLRLLDIAVSPSASLVKTDPLLTLFIFGHPPGGRSSFVPGSPGRWMLRRT